MYKVLPKSSIRYEYKKLEIIEKIFIKKLQIIFNIIFNSPISKYQIHYYKNNSIILSGDYNYYGIEFCEFQIRYMENYQLIINYNQNNTLELSLNNITKEKLNLSSIFKFKLVLKLIKNIVNKYNYKIILSNLLIKNCNPSNIILICLSCSSCLFGKKILNYIFSDIDYNNIYNNIYNKIKKIIIINGNYISNPNKLNWNFLKENIIYFFL